MSIKNLITDYENLSQSILTGDEAALKNVLKSVDKVIIEEISPYTKIFLNHIKNRFTPIRWSQNRPRLRKFARIITE